MAAAGREERDRWRRVQSLFHRARELGPDERAAFLARHRGADASLVEEVEGLLAEALSEPWQGPGTGEDLSGRRFGSYSLERIVGEGSMGVIYEARQAGVERTVALKVLRGRDEFLRAGGTPEAYGRMARRFAAEAEVLGLLDHPGIVPIHELESEDGRSYFTMRLVRGEDFRAVIDRVRGVGEGWTLARALGLLLRVCETMAFAHARGVLHRDLKPSHVMVGGFGEVYVVDWGLAKLPGRAEERDLRLREEPDEGATASLVPTPLRTVEGDVIGTPAYMPPEQARGELARLGARSDVYALGALLYHLLAGRPPYVEDDPPPSAREVLERVRRGPPRGLRAVAPAVAPALVAIQEKAMAREPEERYAGMEELARDLRAFLENRVVSAHRTGRLAVLGKWLQRNTLLAGACGVLGLVGIGWAASVARKNRELAEAVLAAERERDHARVESGFSEATVRFLMDVFRSLHPEEAQGREVSMRDALDLAAAGIEGFEAEPRVRAAVGRTLGVAYARLGELERAEPHLRLSHATLERELGPRHEQTIATLGELGVVLRELARYAEAEPLLRRTLELARESEGEDGLVALRALGNLGQLLFDRGALDEGLALATRLCERQLALGGPRSPELPPTYELLGSIQDARGELEEAERWFRRQLELDRELFGAEHSSTLVAAQNLASVLSALGRGEEALELALGAAARLVEVFGPHHRNALVGQGNLALHLVGAGEVEEGLALLRETLATQEEVQGPEHPDTVQTRANLAKTLRFQRRTDEALEHYRRLDAGHRARGAPDHELGVLLVGFADCLMAAGEHEQAVGALRRLLPVHRAWPERTEATLADTGERLAQCYRALGWEAELEALPAELRGEAR